MKVRVVLFAKPRELVGQPNVDLALPAGATAADAWSQLSTRYDLGPLPRSFRCAVNSEYAGWDDPLKDGDELAVIPPVSGGAIGERRGVVALREEPLDPMAIANGIRSEADGALVLFQGIVREHSRAAVSVEGHTDGKGSAAYNQALSERRAASVARWLKGRKGLNKVRFDVRGFGASKPVAPNAKPDGSDDPDGRQKNRRVEIVVGKK